MEIQVSDEIVQRDTDEEFVTYSLREVSDMTRIPLSAVYAYVRDGELCALIPHGAKRGRMVTKAELRRFLAEGATTDVR